MNRKNGRNTDGTFAAGNSGKPIGARHKATKAVEELLEGEAEKLTRLAIELALDGNVEALKLCLARISPPRRDRTVSFELISKGEDGNSVSMTTNVLAALAAGHLSPGEATSVMKLIETHVRVREFEQLEQRLASVEAQLAQ